MPAEDWRYIGAALLGVAGVGVWIAGFRLRKKLRPIGDPNCPQAVYIEALGSTKTGTGAWTYAPAIIQASAHWGIPADLLMGLIHTESRFNPQAGSHKGAVGLSQHMPKTAAGRYGKLVEQGQWPFDRLTTNNDPQAAGVLADKGVADFVDRTDPFQSIWMGASSLRSKFDRGWDTEHALASYNAGEGRVKRDMPSSEWPSETQNYVPAVLRRAKIYRGLWENECKSAA